MTKRLATKLCTKECQFYGHGMLHDWFPEKIIFQNNIFVTCVATEEFAIYPWAQVHGVFLQLKGANLWISSYKLIEKDNRYQVINCIPEPLFAKKHAILQEPCYHGIGLVHEGHDRQSCCHVQRTPAPKQNHGNRWRTAIVYFHKLEMPTLLLKTVSNPKADSRLKDSSKSAKSKTQTWIKWRWAQSGSIDHKT